jgi:hypothetical protein
VNGQVLRRVELAAVAHGHEQLAVGREGEARAEMDAAAHFRLLPEDHLRAIEGGRRVVEAAARHRRRGAALARLGEGEVDEAARGEIGRKGDVEQPALALRQDARHAFERLRDRAVRCDDPQAPGALCHEHAPVRQEGETPGVLEPVGDGLDQDLGLVGLEARLRRRGRERGDRQQGAGERGACKHVASGASVFGMFGTPTRCRRSRPGHMWLILAQEIEGESGARSFGARGGAGSPRR